MLNLFNRDKKNGFLNKIIKAYYNIFDNMLSNGTVLVGVVAIGIISSGFIVSPTTKVSANYYNINILGAKNENKIDLSKQYIEINGVKYEVILKNME